VFEGVRRAMRIRLMSFMIESELESVIVASTIETRMRTHETAAMRERERVFMRIDVNAGTSPSLQLTFS